MTEERKAAAMLKLAAQSIAAFPELAPKPGERVGTEGLPIRSNAAWRNLAIAALEARNLAIAALEAQEEAKQYGAALSALAGDGTRLNDQHMTRSRELYAKADDMRAAVLHVNRA